MPGRLPSSTSANLSLLILFVNGPHRVVEVLRGLRVAGLAADVVVHRGGQSGVSELVRDLPWRLAASSRMVAVVLRNLCEVTHDSSPATVRMPASSRRWWLWRVEADKLGRTVRTGGPLRPGAGRGRCAAVWAIGGQLAVRGCRERVRTRW